MSERFVVEVDITAKDNTGKALKGVKGGFQEAFDKVVKGALEGAGRGLTSFAAKIPQMGVELVKLGVKTQAVDQRFQKFSGSADNATRFLAAFQEGTDNTVDRMSAMSSASRLLQMGLVGTSGEMRQMAAMGSKLGDQTKSVGDRMADWGALLANQSIPRLDNFGISSGRVRKRINELLETGKALNREEAFKMAVMEEGAKALDTLGNTADTTATRLAQLKRAGADLTQSFGTQLAAGFDDAATGSNKLVTGMDRLSARFREIPRTQRESAKAQEEWSEAVRSLDLQRILDAFQGIRDVNREYAERTREAQAATVGWARGHEQLRGEIEVNNRIQRQGLQIADQRIRSDGEILHGILATQEAIRREGIPSQQELMSAVLNASQALDEEKRAAEKTARALAVDLQRAALSTAQALTSQAQSIEEQAEQANTEREKEERRHQDELEKLRKRGQARAIRIDEDAETKKLRNLREKLELALLDQGAFTDKTKEATRKRKEISIRNLNEQIAEQERLLGDHHAGRLLTTGENVNGLIAEEQRRHDESVALLNDQMAQQEEAQQQATGRMVLQAFEAWVETSDLSEDEAHGLRQKIMLEYGLITEDMVIQTNAWLGAFDNYATGATTSLDEVIKEVRRSGTAFALLKAKIDAIPREVIIRIRQEQATATRADPTRMGGEILQGGTGFASGGLAMVGERGPEMAFIPRGAQVFPTDQSRHMTQNFNLSVNSASTSMGVQNDFGLMESLAAA